MAAEARRAALVALLAVGTAGALRFGLVEPVAMAAVCDADPWLRADCALRKLTIEAFAGHRLGAFALGAALLATLTRRHWIAGLALAASGAGLVLYSAGLAAPAALLALLVFARPAAR